MDNKFLRTEGLIGKDGLEKLKNSKVAVFGIGGVGSYSLEALARSGVGTIYIYDNPCSVNGMSSPYFSSALARFAFMVASSSQCTRTGLLLIENSFS
ncbi:MAG: ThiF family adenylyltransferase, partial [Clostridia bacterium]|nr:ThiF family adenylyltransferase [Clostridia bacterium]